MGTGQHADLNPAELEALGILWAEAPLKPSEIEEAFSYEIENATLRSVLRGLVDKGFLKREKVGKAYYYRTAKAAKSVRKNLTAKLASVFAEGSRFGLIAQLVKDEKLTPEQIEELKSIANEK